MSLSLLPHFWHWIEVHTGTVNEPGPYYGFWSGFGSDIGELAIIGGLVHVARDHNCHVKGCWSIRSHPVEGTTHRVCRRHHPAMSDVPPTVEDVHRDHRVAQLP